MTDFIDLSHSSVHGVRILASGSAQITLVTQELEPNEFKQLAQAMRDGTQITTRIKPQLEGGKTASQRLRNALYKDWETNCRGGDFESYYDSQMTKYIEDVKARIPETKYDESYSK
jgi:hypothetical protein